MNAIANYASSFEWRSLIRQLKTLRQFADQGYWITQLELCSLLNLSLNQLDGQQSPQLRWRNFSFQYQGCQAGSDFWLIATHPVQKPSPVVPKNPPRLIAASRSLLPDPKAEFIASQVVQIDQFLAQPEVERLWQFVLNSEANFEPTSVTTTDVDYRRSMVLYHFDEFMELMRSKVRQAMPEVLEALELKPFPLGEIEIQLTAHNDGNFYKTHNDNGSPITASRVLTYVYYFNGQPKAFSGGELCVYDTQAHDQFFQAAPSFKLVEPRHNSIVFFPSFYMHEVLEVKCPSRRFADGRFTLNGWVRQADPVAKPKTPPKVDSLLGI